MAEIKYTKSALRGQQIKLTQLERYLPTLQLKKALLQMEINQAAMDLEKCTIQQREFEKRVQEFRSLLTGRDAPSARAACVIKGVKKHYENIAGVEIPVFESIAFVDAGYHLFDTPIWFESAISRLKDLIITREKIEVLEEKKRLLEKELREVSIRVNLFEKIMIPRTKESIKKIKIFLGDQQLAAVSQAKVAKRKIEERKRGAA